MQGYVTIIENASTTRFLTMRMCEDGMINIQISDNPFGRKFTTDEIWNLLENSFTMIVKALYDKDRIDIKREPITMKYANEIIEKKEV